MIMTLRRAIIALALCTAVAATAQEYRHSPAGQPDPYEGWTRPGGGSCCSGRDCAPVQACTIDGREGWLEGGRCWPLPPDRETQPPPEVWQYGDLHVCRSWTVGIRPDGTVGHVSVVYCWAMTRGA